MVMFQDVESAEVLAQEFQKNFDRILPLIVEEWPTLSPDALVAIAGDWSKVVDYIALKTEHTRTLTQRHLQELYHLALTPSPQQRIAPEPSPATSSVPRSAVDELLHLMECRTDELVEQFKRDILPELSHKARKNVGTTLLISLGIGFVLGLLMGGGRERR